MATAEHGDAPPYCSVFDLFKIGIGPSSSHSVGPMRAAARFLQCLRKLGSLSQVGRVRVELFGSLALTGIGHGTDRAVLLGLLGERPDEIDTARIPEILRSIRERNVLQLGGEQEIGFDEAQDILFHRRKTLPRHPNALRFSAYGHDTTSDALFAETYYSIGGGFVIAEHEDRDAETQSTVVPYPFSTARELLELTRLHGKPMSWIAWQNEIALRGTQQVRTGLERIWETMEACIERGCATEGVLPGGLNLRRRAPALYHKLKEGENASESDPLKALDWVDLYALAVNEENAAGGRVVTAPTNGAAGIIPAVLRYYLQFGSQAEPQAFQPFLLTAAVVGALYKQNASISGAEVGCQGEVGVACSMAAGALTEVLGGSPRQVEQAAEIGMEHNLGLTCDPIKGLVQIPCIERNAMGAVKAINASRMALRSDGEHFVSLDRVIRVMKRTGADMSSRYKETSRGGLAVNISEC